MQLCVLYIFIYVYGLTWQDLGSGRSASVASVRRQQKLPPCPTETVSIGFHMDLLLAKAEPTSDAGSNLYDNSCKKR